MFTYASLPTGDPAVCNNYKLEVPAAQLAMAFGEPLQYPGGVPNLEPRADIRIGDTPPVVVQGDGGPELRTVQWAWPPTGVPHIQLPHGGPRLLHLSPVPHPRRRLLRIHGP